MVASWDCNPGLQSTNQKGNDDKTSSRRRRTRNRCFTTEDCEPSSSAPASPPSQHEEIGQQQQSSTTSRRRGTFHKQRAATEQDDDNEEHDEDDTISDMSTTQPGAFNVGGRVPPSDGTVMYSMGGPSTLSVPDTPTNEEHRRRIHQHDDDDDDEELNNNDNLVVAELAPTTVEGTAVILMPTPTGEPSATIMDHNGGGGAAATTAVSEANSSSWKKAFYMVSIVLIIIVVGVVVVAVLFLIPTDEKDSNAFESQTNVPSNIPSVIPQSSPTPRPTTISTPGPTTTPTLAPIPTLTATPTPQPISSPTPEPSPRPTSTPTADPTPRPTSVPTPDPTPQPTVEPTTSNPTGSSNLGVCIVCPDDEPVTNPDNFVPFTSPDGFEQTSIRCDQLQELGRQGLIPADDCDDSQATARFICGCGTSNATPMTTVNPTLRPTTSPVSPPFTGLLGPLLDDPVIIWTSVVQAGIMKGNGAFLTPGQQHIVTTSVDGTVTSFDAASGSVVWEYQPPAVGGAGTTCHSNMVFTTSSASTPYMVYSVVHNENSANPTTRVIALDIDGTSLWVSEPLAGVAAGSPLISSNGRYVFLTHNTDFKTIGYFTALFSAQGGVTFYSMSNDTAPFSEPGIFHSPIEGYYDGLNGVGNQNDVILWANAVPSDATAIGLGSTFVFQFPIGFVDTTDNVGYLLLRREHFLAEASPVITNSGRSAYWAVSRSEFLAWVGNGLIRDNFSQGPTGKNSGELNADFRGAPVFASVALSSSTTEPYVFGGTAAPEFVRFNFDLSLKNSKPVNDLILAEAKVDPNDRVVYYVEESGVLHQAYFDDLEDRWTFDMGFPVAGELALTSDGTVLYVADRFGLVSAFQVGEVPRTSAPSSSP